MAFTKQALTLFWSLPPQEADWSNLNLSKVRRVMLPLKVAIHNRAVLAHLASLQKRVVIRLEEDDVYGMAPTLIRQHITDMLRIVTIDALILGCEPEHEFDLKYGSANWGNQGEPGAPAWVWHHAHRINVIADVMDGVAVKVVSPGWTHRSITEDDVPQPGYATWAECTRLAYNKCDGAGVHLYAHGWKSWVDAVRMRFALRMAADRHHTPLWIDEIGVNSGTQVERMRGYLEFADWLLQAGNPYGARVEMLCPFVSNGDPGNPPVWPPGLLLSDPAVYRMLGEWMNKA